MSIDSSDERKILRLRRRERVREFPKIILICSNWLAAPLFAVFWIADYFYAHDHFFLFGALRLLVLPSCLLLNIQAKRTNSLAKLQVWGGFHVFVDALVITIMAFLAEGKTSVYYAGLNLLTIAVGSFIPWTPVALVCNVSLIYLPYLAWSFLTWGSGGHAIFLVNCFFMGTTIVLTLVIRHFNEAYRMSAIRSTFALQNELKRRATVIQEKTAETLRLEEQFRQAQKMEAIGRLAGGIAHDFNNLLMVIQSYAEMLREDRADDVALREKTEYILKAASRAAGLTRQMLAFSRKQILSPIVLDLNAVIDEAATMLKRLIGEDIEFRVLQADALWKVEVDPDQIVQVVMNLCVNARDAMPQGGVLTIATANVSPMQMKTGKCSDAPRGEYVKLSVTDTGIGISKQIQERIFDPFFTTKEVGKGTGLGLATVYGIVKQSGGYLSVESEPGHGACFTIYLPRVEQAITPEEPTTSEAQPRGTETILVAEDEDSVREALCDSIRRLGYTVLAASSGPQALSLAAWHQGPIELLITDVVMPKMNGRELSERLTHLRPNLRTIFISGYTDDTVLRHGIKKLGAVLLQKPFNLNTLACEVRNRLAGEKTRQCTGLYS
jgi:signal transduction histidine kinase/CheY-like chemotaxis protein